MNQKDSEMSFRYNRSSGCMLENLTITGTQRKTTQKCRFDRAFIVETLMKSEDFR